MLRFINSRLSIGLRLALVAGILIAASAISAALLANYGMGNIDFSQKEKYGTEYNGLIWLALQKDRSEVSDHARYDAMFGSARAQANFAETRRWQDRVTAANALILKVADSSNLTLDPDLDSYYAMDAATVKLPILLATSLQLEAELALPASVSGRQVVASIALDRFRTAADAVFSSIDASIKGNADGITEQALMPARVALEKVADAMIAAARANLDARPADYDAAKKPFEAAVDKAWVATNDELLRLLDVRLAGLKYGLVVNIALVVALIALSLFLATVINFGLSRRFKALGTAMTRLNAGDKTVEVPYLDDRNETGAIAKTLAQLKQTLIQRVADEKQREADREAATAAEKQAEAEDRARAEAQALQRQRDREAADEAQKRAGEEAQANAMHMVVSSFGEGLKGLASRDLTSRIRAALPEGYRGLQADFNAALDHLSAAMAEISHTAGDIASSAAQINAASQDLSQRTEHQAASLEKSAAAMDQITATVGKSAENAKQANSTALDAKKDADLGSDVVKRTMRAMHDIAHSSGEIGNIIGVIDEIAFQTNILALNAGVEAARAGEAGRGFAVVASEVRALAQRSAEAAKQIKTLVQTSESQVTSGVKLVEESGLALSRIVDDITKITALMNDIANAQQEQAVALGEVNTAVGHMDQTTQQNAAMVEQSTAASKSLADDAKVLADLVAGFQMEQSGQYEAA